MQIENKTATKWRWDQGRLNYFQYALVSDKNKDSFFEILGR